MQRGCESSVGSRSNFHRCFNTSSLVAYTADLVNVIRTNERNARHSRPVSSGFGVTRATAWHQEYCHPGARPSEVGSNRRQHCADSGESGIDTPEQHRVMVQWQHEAVDIISTHVYAGLRGCWFGRAANRKCHRQTNTTLLAAAADAAAAVGKPLYIGEYGGPYPNFTGPSAASRAYPESVLRWLVARAQPEAEVDFNGFSEFKQPQTARTAAAHGPPRVLSSIWAWACASKRRTGMQCLWPRGEDEGGSNHGARSSDEEEPLLVRMLEAERELRKGT